jgi:hypothetical protein
VTAKTSDGNEIYAESKTYMPIPSQFARGEAMGRGPYDKSGLIEDTGLPVNQTVFEKFEIHLPEDMEGGSGATAAGSRDIEVGVRLFYLPFGQMDVSPFLWHEVVRKITLEDG